jgi:hypothetical protein
MIFAMWFRFQKIPQKYPQKFVIFQKVGDGFCYEKNFIEKKIYITIFTISILRCLKKNFEFAKEFHVLSCTCQVATNAKVRFKYLQVV